MRFSTEGYFEDSRIEESRLVYVPISHQISDVATFKVKLVELELQDYEAIMMDSITRREFDNLFSFDEMPRYPAPFRDNSMITITVEMDMHVEHFERQVYTLFDMASDVGGLGGILVSIFLILNSLWNYN